MKRCWKCKRSYSFEAFGKNIKKKDGLSPECKKCKREYNLAYYKSHIPQVKERMQKRVELLQDKFFTYLSKHPCVDCGEDNIVVLDFDHQENKIMEISKMVHRGFLWKKVLLEIKKCEIRCANCHRIKTMKLNNYRKYNFRNKFSPEVKIDPL